MSWDTPDKDKDIDNVNYKWKQRSLKWGITNILYKSNSKVIFSQKYT